MEQEIVEINRDIVKEALENSKDIFREYSTNPTIELVGSLLFESKKTIRSVNTRIGKVQGKLTKISTDERTLMMEDRSKFVKVFLDSGALLDFIDLSKTAQRIMAHIIDTLEYNKDYVFLHNYRLVKETGLGNTSVSLGKKELIEKQWLFNTPDTAKYWINLCYICLGDREEIYRRFKQTGQ